MNPDSIEVLRLPNPILIQPTRGGIRNYVLVCREGEETEFDLDEIEGFEEVRSSYLVKELNSFFDRPDLEIQTFSGRLDENKKLKKWKIHPNAIDERRVSIKPASITGWMDIPFSEQNVRLTLFLAPKFMAIHSSSDEIDYHQLSLRFLKTLIYSKDENYQRVFFSKNLANVTEFIPVDLILHYFADLIEELFTSGPGLAREYVTEYIEETVVRGRIDYGTYLRTMHQKPHQLPQYHTKLTTNSRYSQFLLHALHRGIEVASKTSAKRGSTSYDYDRLNEFLPWFHGVHHREMPADYFEGIEVPSTLLEYRDCLAVASMIIGNQVSSYHQEANRDVHSMHLLYSPEYIFEGIVSNLMKAAVEPLEMNCENYDTKPIAWTGELEYEEEDNMTIKNKTDHVIQRNGVTVAVLESKHTSTYSKKKAVRISKADAAQLIVSMITWKTHTGLITAPMVEDKDEQPSNPCKKADHSTKPHVCDDKLVGVPTASFPKENFLFGYAYADSKQKRPKLHLLYIDTSVVVKTDSPEYMAEVERLRELIRFIEQKPEKLGTIQPRASTPAA